MSQPALSGPIHAIPVANETDELVRENERLQECLRESRDEMAQMMKSVVAYMERFRQLHEVLGAMLGEANSVSSQSVNTKMPQSRGVWESWINKLGGRRADIIRALLEHGAMTGTQIRISAHIPEGSLGSTIHDLKKLGLISKNGQHYSLKEL
jgi:hypothetical protein